jgi:hypothetical protein
MEMHRWVTSGPIIGNYGNATPFLGINSIVWDTICGIKKGGSYLVC